VGTNSSAVWRKIRKADWGGFLRGVYDYNVARHFKTLPPRAMMVPITYRCNSRCVMCNIWQWERKPEMSPDQFRSVLDDPLFGTIERLTFTGGEPLLRSDLMEVTDVFMEAMPNLRSFSFVTNGFMPERAEEYARAVLDRCEERSIGLSVSVSLDGLGQLHDEIRGVPGGFKKTEETLMRMKALGENHEFWLGANCVVFKANLYHLGDLREWCEERGISLGYQIIGFHETYVSNADQQEQLDFSDDDRAHLFEFLDKLAKPRSIDDTSSFYWSDVLRMYRDGDPRRTPCPFKWDALALDCYGDLYHCLNVKPFANCLTDGTCSQLYYDRDNLARRRRMYSTVCTSCDSGCMVRVGLKKDLKRYVWFLLTGR
jgi:MoaA/NifB/PqqE/SkfB family radical SAM enzyme